MVKAPEVCLAPRRWSVLELSLSHMYYVHFQFLTLKSVQEFYMHTFGYKDVKAPSDWHQRGHSSSALRVYKSAMEQLMPLA